MYKDKKVFICEAGQEDDVTGGSFHPIASLVLRLNLDKEKKKKEKPS